MDDTAIAYINLLADDRNSIPYRPKLARILGGVLPAILLQQVVYRWANNDYKPFYKFKDRCGHQLYRPGDSWIEELAFGPVEFVNALGTIGTKITKGMSKQKVLDVAEPVWTAKPSLANANHLIVYWTDASRVTWYHVNGILLGKVLHELYLGKLRNIILLSKAPNSTNHESDGTAQTHETGVRAVTPPYRDPRDSQRGGSPRSKNREPAQPFSQADLARYAQEGFRLGSDTEDINDQPFSDVD